MSHLPRWALRCIFLPVLYRRNLKLNMKPKRPHKGGKQYYRGALSSLALQGRPRNFRRLFTENLFSVVLQHGRKTTALAAALATAKRKRSTGRENRGAAAGEVSAAAAAAEAAEAVAAEAVAATAATAAVATATAGATTTAGAEYTPQTGQRRREHRGSDIGKDGVSSTVRFDLAGTLIIHRPDPPSLFIGGRRGGQARHSVVGSPPSSELDLSFSAHLVGGPWPRVSHPPTQKLIALRPSNYACACCQNGN